MLIKISKIKKIFVTPKVVRLRLEKRVRYVGCPIKRVVTVSNPTLD